MPSNADHAITRAASGEIDSNVVRMTQLITGFFASQAIRAFAELGIADQLAERPATAGDLSAALGTDPGATSRLMRAGVVLDLVIIDDQQRFCPTPLLRTL